MAANETKCALFDIYSDTSCEETKPTPNSFADIENEVTNETPLATVERIISSIASEVDQQCSSFDTYGEPETIAANVTVTDKLDALVEECLRTRSDPEFRKFKFWHSYLYPTHQLENL